MQLGIKERYCSNCFQPLSGFGGALNMNSCTLHELLNAKEGENIEFKENKNHFDFEELVQYACAIANCGGGRVVFGITNQRPRQVVGTTAVPQPERTRRGLIDRLGLNIDFQLFEEESKQVVVFVIPSRPVGMPIQDRGKDKGVIWWRDADSLIPMPPDVMRSIFAESGHDFSSDVCHDATLADLDEVAINVFREKWAQKNKKPEYAISPLEQLLLDAEAVTSTGGVTYAALALFGKHAAMGRLLAQCEVVFEYRATEAAGPAQQRVEFRHGFFAWFNELWRLINLRNDIQHYQNGLFVWDVPTFDERAVREAIMNAICHRNYQLSGSVFVIQYPRKLIVTSPGGFPPGITTENILTRQSPRNRRIAELLARCGLVERAGQGLNLMFELSIRQAKKPPKFLGTDNFQVRLTLEGLVEHPALLAMMERIGQETLQAFATEDFLTVDAVHRGHTIQEALRGRLQRLIELGVIERAGKGKYILRRRFYAETGEKGVYTRKRGLDRETNKALLLKHLHVHIQEGSRLGELCQVLPGSSAAQVKSLLRDMKKAGKVQVVGHTNAARWFPAALGLDT
jgi:ATP-dependent DNA helicase RecG